MESVEFLGLNGCALSVAETTALKCSLLLLSTHTQQKLTWWGKVQGYEGDYHIASSATSNDGLLKPRSFYFSTDGGTNWTPLTEISDEQKGFAEEIRGPFTGNPAYQYKLQKDLPPEDTTAVDEAAAAAAAAALAEAEEAAEEEGAGEAEEAEEGADGGAAGETAEGEETEEKKPAKKLPKYQIIVIPEAVRLAYFVGDYEKNCRIVPRAAFIQTGDGNSKAIVRNKTFRGLELDASLELRNYFRLELQGDATVNSGLFGHNYSASSDFLVSIVGDVPHGVWAPKVEASMGVVVIQNLVFNGSLFWHRLDTSEFGQFYVGPGERNLDLCFMLP